MSTNASHTNTTPGDIPGRWAISGTGLSNAILLDTATGETWHANPDGFWVRMLHAEDSPTGSFQTGSFQASVFNDSWFRARGTRP